MKTIPRIGFILFVIILLPALTFSVYEINSLNKDEETLNQIYANQLETILFSANQYADDILNTWVKRIETDLVLSQNDNPSGLHSIMDSYQSVENILAYNIENHQLKNYAKDSTVNTSSELYSEFFMSNTDLCEVLINYQEQGYQKIEAKPFDTSGAVALLFVPANFENKLTVCAIIIDPLLFIDEILGPKIQGIAQDQFNISIVNQSKDSLVYTTADSINSIQNPDVQTKALWLLPDYQLSIFAKSKSIDELIAERTTTDLFLIIFLDVILIIGVIIIFRNVKKEVKLAQNKSEFISNVSHELRTPLALINMYAETLQLGRINDPDKIKAYYETILNESQRLTNIVNKILSFSQYDAGKKKLSLSPSSLSEIVVHILNRYQVQFENEHFELIQDIDDDVVVHLDEDAMMEVLINLIDNAVKYSSNTKRIIVKLKKQKNEVQLSITDFGIGISKEDQLQIFDKFYRSASGNLAKKEGTGIGLAIVKRIVDDFGAKIKVESQLSQGATFTICFPLNPTT